LMDGGTGVGKFFLCRNMLSI